VHSYKSSNIGSTRYGCADKKINITGTYLKLTQIKKRKEKQQLYIMPEKLLNWKSDMLSSSILTMAK
jgi:endo-beta-N-acetylglucosaminidase D